VKYLNTLKNQWAAISILFFAVQLTASGQGPVAEFTANKVSGCAPLTVQFTDQSTGILETVNYLQLQIQQ
jgi:PKD repeat protein